LNGLGPERVLGHGVRQGISTRKKPPTARPTLKTVEPAKS